MALTITNDYMSHAIDFETIPQPISLAHCYVVTFDNLGLDSDAASHMTCCRDWLFNYESIDSHSIYTFDMDPYQATGRGAITTKCLNRNGTTLLHNFSLDCMCLTLTSIQSQKVVLKRSMLPATL
ncbi:hypothetical protein BASA50_004776 [Batrachochytrium salamandrivorans]|uniref:Retrovirus-related Pol polyprotein from transposon TNT 1-94-like beta-barrel domain-containing protein n=1 Tax=Batrachochytrium salamandrivorans TaxID=1357716 RepID=A0ABQ8FEQ2_9FUNG|nr:hypothetical protein BASA50_004776 [Batrachochytrium salamandrivorans]